MSRQNMIPQSPFVLRVASVAQVPGLAGASAALQAQFNALPIGSIVTEDATYKVYVKSDARAYALGGRIQPVSTGAGIPGTPASVLFDAANPNTFVTLDSSGAGASLAPANAWNLLNRTKLGTWKAQNGLGTASASTLTVTLPAATVPANYSQQPVLFDNEPAQDPFGSEFSAQINSFTGSNGNQFLCLTFGHDLTTVPTPPLGQTGVGSLVSVAIYFDGGMNVYAGDINTIFSGSGGLLFDGQDWIRLSYLRGWVSVATGRGTSIDTVSWTMRQSIRGNGVPANSTQFSGLKMGLAATAGAAGQVSATIGSTYWTRLV